MANNKLLIALVGLILPWSGMAQRTYINAEGYSVIDCFGMPSDSYEVRAINYAPGGLVPRHDLSRDPVPNTPNALVSARFAVSPPLRNSKTNQLLTMTWAEAAGWHTNANGTNWDIDPPNTPADPGTGCSVYTGMGGGDLAGTWRLPTQREATIVCVFLPIISKNPNFDYAATAQSWYFHWTATEGSDNADPEKKRTHAIAVKWMLPRGTTPSGEVAPYPKTNKYHVRCVKDIRH